MSASKVLVVTNDEGFGDAVRDFVGDAAGVETVRTRDEALHWLTRSCPDLVLLDHDTAELECMDMLSIARALRCRFECVLATKRPSEALSREAAAMGVTHILVKPFSAADLDALIGISTSACVELRSRQDVAASAPPA
jgi:DNA-binding response OmpR family regulator